MNCSKTALSVLLALVLCLCAASCSKGENASKSGKASVLPTVINAQEYVLYQNVFYQDASPYVDTNVSKQGVFTVVQDEFNGKTRYYVWGYYDETKCCDWQWELNITDPSSIPSAGSLVTAGGDFVASDDALDGYWIENVTLTVDTPYSSDGEYDIDMSTMSCTLERVQMANLQHKAGAFDGMSVKGYGRLNTVTSIQDPYYDGSWVMDFDEWKDSNLSVGTIVVFSGVWKSGSLSETKLIYNNPDVNIY